MAPLLVSVMLSLFGTSTTGANLIGEMQTGSHERQLVTPLHRSALLIGRALKEIAPTIVQALVVIAVTVPFGLRPSAAGVLAFLAADRAFMRGAFRTPPGDVAMLALIPSLLWNAPAALAAAGVTLALLAVRRFRPGYAIDLMSPEDKADAVSDLEELGGAPRTDWAPMGPLCGLIVLASVLSGFSFG